MKTLSSTTKILCSVLQLMSLLFEVVFGESPMLAWRLARAGFRESLLALVGVIAVFSTPGFTQAVPTMFGAEFAAGGEFYSVDVTNGSVSILGTTSGTSFFAGMDFSSDGALWAAAGFLYEVDPTDGSEISRRNIDFSVGDDIITGLSFSPGGELFGIGNGNGNLWKIDTVTAEAELIGTSGESIFSLEFAGDGTLYGAGFNLYTIDPADGSANLIGDIGIALINALDFAPNGVMYGASSGTTDDALYRINLSTGEGTLIGFTGGDLVSLASVPVPEPDSLAILCVGTVVASVLRSGARRIRPRLAV